VNRAAASENIKLNRDLHAKNREFGNNDGSAMNLLQGLMLMHKRGACNSVLDYGTGKGKLVHRLRQILPEHVTVRGYDPCVEEWSQKPCHPFDIVTCLDVLEHVELAEIDVILNDIKKLTGGFCLLVIDLQPAGKNLPDGRNAHILLAPPEWWVTRIAQQFKCQTSFTISHKIGLPQKLVIAATENQNMLPLVYEFVLKMDMFNMVCLGGPLDKKRLTY